LSIDSFVGNAVEDGSINCSSGPISSSSSTKGVSGSKGGKKKGTKKFGSKNMLRATSNVHAQNTYDRCKDETVYQLSPKKQPAHPVTPVKKLEIGAGALIKQRVYDDPKMIDYWEKEPAGMIYINYCDEETKKKIIDGGRRVDEKDGFLKDVKIGG